MARIEEIQHPVTEILPRVHLRCEDGSFFAVNWRWTIKPMLHRQYRFYTVEQSDIGLDETIDTMLSMREPHLIPEHDRSAKSALNSSAIIAMLVDAIEHRDNITIIDMPSESFDADCVLDVRIKVCKLHTLEGK